VHDSEVAIEVTAGHWTDHEARTGCTVLLFDRPARAVADVRGGAPGTRETDLLKPGNLVRAVDAILLTGGSAFGLDATGGVMAYLRESGRGVITPAGPVPIVPSAVLYDLSVGLPRWPVAANAYEACKGARLLAETPRGLVGAGTGATTRKMFADHEPMRGGIGIGLAQVADGAMATAVVAVNAAGEVVVDVGAPDPRPGLLDQQPFTPERVATTIGVVAIDAPVDERTLIRCATAAHAGLARSIRPSHTILDGDTMFAIGLRTGNVDVADVLKYSVAVELAVERAIIDAITA